MDQELREKIESQIKEYPVLLFMKGTPQFPQCGFSSRVVSILKKTEKPFAYINILQEQEVRSALPQISNWPTFPQLFINGELVGGCDIIAELDEDGELLTMLNDVNWPEDEGDDNS